MLSSGVLQIIAVITMIIDHIGYYFLDDELWCRLIGRLSMPIFMFLLVQGSKHTHSVRKYLLRILLAAVVAQIAYYLLAIIMPGSDYQHNIMFTLAFSLLALCATKTGIFAAILIPIIILLAELFGCEYGALGVLLAVGFYYADKLFVDNRPFLILSEFVVLSAVTISMVQHFELPMQIAAIFAIIPIALYSGKKGHRLPRYFCYFFYPAHLFVFFLAKLVLN